MSYDTQTLLKKWQPVLEHADLPQIADAHKRTVVATLLENQERDAAAQQSSGFLSEAGPTNSMGTSAVPGGSTGAINFVDPVLISLVRRSAPNLIAYDVCGVQAMTGPTGLIFAMRSRYNSQTGREALFNEANTSFSAIGSTVANTANFGGVLNGAAGTTATGTNPNLRASGSGYTIHTGMSTAKGEALGDAAGNAIAQMAFSVEKVAVTAVTRALKAEWSVELAQDLKALHGLDAETELANILSTEILAEQNREMIRTINYTATAGAQENVTAAGTYDLDTDANGRWSVEKFKGLMFQIEREANAIAKATRRGKGNVIICSSDVASALQMAGVLDYTPALNNSLQVDDSGNTFAGVLNGRYKVFIDPYFSSADGSQYLTVGYKGSSQMDAGLFYCPYVALQQYRAVDPGTFQPKIAYKTRYGLVANPFATSAGDGLVSYANANKYYRTLKVTNIS